MQNLEFKAYDKINKVIVEVDSIDYKNKLVKFHDSKNEYTRKFEDIELMQDTWIFDKKWNKIHYWDILEIYIWNWSDLYVQNCCYKAAVKFWWSKAIFTWNDVLFENEHDDFVGWNIMDLQDVLMDMNDDKHYENLLVIWNVFQNSDLLWDDFNIKNF